MNKNVELISAWAEYVKKLETLFKNDPEVKVVYDNTLLTVNLYVSSQDKAYALDKLLPEEVQFGNITLKVAVIPPNIEECSTKELFEKAFEGNDVYRFTTTVERAFTNPITYVVFAPKVAQYHNDDIGDINGNRSTLYHELAKEVFNKEDGVFYCTGSTSKGVWRPWNEGLNK